MKNHSFDLHSNVCKLFATKVKTVASTSQETSEVVYGQTPDEGTVNEGPIKTLNDGTAEEAPSSRKQIAGCLHPMKIEEKLSSPADYDKNITEIVSVVRNRIKIEVDSGLVANRLVEEPFFEKNNLIAFIPNYLTKKKRLEMPLSDTSSTREPSEFETDSGSYSHPPSDAESSTTRESFTEDGLVAPGSSRGKKRKKNNSVWKRSKSKLERNSGKSYLNSRGRIVSKKQCFHGVCSSPRKCHLLLSLEERKNIFQSFYNLSDCNLQTAYINIQVKCCQ
ncbi:unnamed protein product [Diabrotica balteata]|uniref:Uncharacterized protein n=1 Tax=Diabrotica balteata TaxID=107213 RepID=A0A9P0E202_DIABA|nr:unnamed protein product [Diabrotica balteata]